MKLELEKKNHVSSPSLSGGEKIKKDNFLVVNSNHNFDVVENIIEAHVLPKQSNVLNVSL